MRTRKITVVVNVNKPAAAIHLPLVSCAADIGCNSPACSWAKFCAVDTREMENCKIAETAAVYVVKISYDRELIVGGDKIIHIAATQ